MRKLVLSMFTSVDGFINAPGGAFIGPEWSADLDRWTSEMVDRFDTLVYGRVAWQDMAAYWPGAPTDASVAPAQRDLARFMNASRKIVFSRTLRDAAAWANSELATGDAGAVLAREKEREGRDLVVFAGADFAQSVVRTGMVDEYWLLTMPMLFGAGSRLFADDGIRTELRLSEVRQMDTGAVLTRYETKVRGS